MPSDVDVRFYVPNGSAWQRMRLPQTLIKSADWEFIERGGMAGGHVELIAPWESWNLTGKERCDIYLGGQPVFRGWARMPEPHLDIPESKIISLFGGTSLCDDWQVRRRYVYPTYVDVSVLAAELIGDYLQQSGRLPGVATDIQHIGVAVQQFDHVGKGLAEAMNALLDLSPGEMIWGFDLAPAVGAAPPENRIYLRPRATDTKYHFAVGGNVKAIVVPSDTSAIVNKMYLTGGEVSLANLPANLVANGGFEHPAAPGETSGNLVRNYSFEVGAGGGGISFGAPFPDWLLNSGASVKADSNPGDNNPGSRTGSAWLNLDNPGENAAQIVAIDGTQTYQAWCWARRGPSSPVTYHLKLEVMDASSTVLGTVTSPDTDPGSDLFYSSLAPISINAGLYPTASLIRITLYGNNGSGHNDGIAIDDVVLISTTSVPQSGWRFNTFQAQTLLDWTHKITSSDPVPVLQSGGGYSLMVTPTMTGGSGSNVEINAEATARIKLSRYKTYFLGAHVAAGDLSAQVTVGIRGYGSDGSAEADVESTTYVLGDHDWHALTWGITVGSNDLDGEFFIRVYSSSRIYVDNVFVSQGELPAEYTDDAELNWWEGSQYQRVLSTADTDVVAAGLSTDAAASQTNWGVRERDVSVPGVIDKTSAFSYAVGAFNAQADPKILGSFEISQATTPSGNLLPSALDGRIRFTNLPNAPAPLNIPRLQYKVTNAGITINGDLSNERPSMALLLLGELGQNPNILAAATSAGAGSAATGPSNPAGSGSGSGSFMDLLTDQAAAGNKTFSTGIQAAGYKAADGTPGVDSATTVYLEDWLGNQIELTVDTKTGLVTAVTGLVAPSPPTLLSAQAGNGQVSLTWLGNLDARSYSIYRSTSPSTGYTAIATGITPQIYLDTGLTNGTTYYYYVRETGAGDSQVSNRASAVPSAGATVPAVPTSFTVSAADSQVVAHWHNDATAETVSIGIATVSGGPYTYHGPYPAPVPAGTNQADIQGLANGTTYYLVAKASNAAGDSALTAEQSIAAAVGATPTLPVLTAASGAGQVSLSWTGGTGATSFQIFRALDQKGIYVLAASGLAGSPYVDTNVYAGVTYWYKVIAINGSGSTFSVEQSGTPT